MELQVLDDVLAIARLAANAEVPAWVAGRDFIAVTRTKTELSIICRDDAVPATHTEVQRGFRALAVSGTLDFALTGVIAALTGPLADAGISIFGVSTYDTDHVLVRHDQLERAKDVLTSAGHTVR